MAVFNDSDRLIYETQKQYNDSVKTDNGTLQNFNDLDLKEVLNNIKNYNSGGSGGSIDVKDDTDVETVRTKLKALITSSEALLKDDATYAEREYYKDLQTAVTSASTEAETGTDLAEMKAAFNTLNGAADAFRKGVASEQPKDEWKDIEKTDGLDIEGDGNYKNYDIDSEGDVVITSGDTANTGGITFGD